MLKIENHPNGEWPVLKFEFYRAGMYHGVHHALPNHVQENPEAMAAFFTSFGHALLDQLAKIDSANVTTSVLTHRPKDI